jgi:hypothetical protein
MLSQDDQRRLEEIEREISFTDRGFADGMRDGTPCPPSDDRRWPMMAGALFGLVVLLVGLVAVSPLTSVIGAAGVGGAAIAYRRHLRRAHGGQRRSY